MERIKLMVWAAFAALAFGGMGCVPMAGSSAEPLYGVGEVCAAADIGATIPCPGHDPANGYCVYQFCDPENAGMATSCTAIPCDGVHPPVVENDGSTGCTPGAIRNCTASASLLGFQLCDVSGNWMMCQPYGPAVDAGTPPVADAGTGCDSDPSIGTACSVGTGECAADGVWACVGGVRECVLNAGEVVGTPVSELCDNLDNDCDGAVDEAVTQSCYGGPAGTRGVGTCTPGTQACSAGTWGSCMGEVLPTAEVPDNSIDENCNGGLLFSVSCGGDPRDGTVCTAGVGVCLDTGTWDCRGNELFCDAIPGTPVSELCDNLDNDCDGSVDESLFQSFYTGPAGTAMVGVCRVGYDRCMAGVWMLDSPEVLPMTEVCGDGVDQNCNGHDDACPTCGGDPRITTPPTACDVGLGLCNAGGVWACDTGSVRCTASPGAAVDEICDNLDQDCDGAVDEDLVQTCYSGDVRFADVGLCRMGTRTCSAGLWNACMGEILPVAEICDDGLDQDCNGSDLRCGTACGSDPRITTPATACATGTGACRATGVYQCTSGTVTCSATPGMPTAELCNGIDDNCNGVLDEAPGGGAIVRSCYPFTTGLPGVGVCRSGTQTCSSGTFGPCSGAVGPSAEVCDGLDNDCDGGADESGVCIVPTADAGPPPVDAGSPAMDAGPMVADSGMGTDAGSAPVDAGTDSGPTPVDAGPLAGCTGSDLCVALSASVAWCPSGGSSLLDNYDNTGGDLHSSSSPLSVPIDGTGIRLNPGEYLNNTVRCEGTGILYFSPVLVGATIGSTAASLGLSIWLNGVDVSSSSFICWDTVPGSPRDNTTALSYHRIQVATRTSPLATGCMSSTGP